MKKILISTAIPREGLADLFDRYHVTYPEPDDSGRLNLSEITNEYHGLLAADIAVDKKLIDKAKNLQIISNYGVGYDNIDWEYAAQKNIVVANTPKSVTEATAELAFALLLSLVRRIAECDRKIRTNPDFEWGVMKNLGNTLYGKSLGIIGLGRIGKAVAKRARTFGMEILYHNRQKLQEPEESALEASYLPMSSLLSASDVISIHIPLTPETRHLVGKKEIGMMKNTAFLINTARGPVLDEKALTQALEQKMIAGAGLDVFENEPIIPSKLKQLNNVVLTPHIGTGTIESRIAMAREAAQNLIDFFEGRAVKNRVN